MGSWSNIKANVKAKYKASADARKAYTEELRTARIREAKILANQRAVLERKQKIARFARRPQTIGRALGLTRSLGTRARGGAGRTLGVQSRKGTRMKQMPIKKIKFKPKRRMKKRRTSMREDNGYDNDYGMGGFGFG